MRFFSALTGRLHLEVTSADPERLLQALAANGVAVYDIQRISDLTIRFIISRTDVPALTRLCEKLGANQKNLHRSGLYWTGRSAIRRPVLMTGLVLILVFCLILPTRVLFVRVKGNQRIPARKIEYAAQESGIGFGASRRAVRSEKVKNALLSSLPELEWVGVNTAGCVAEISVRERNEAETSQPQHMVSHITAANDGYVLSMTVTSGNPLCAPGQQVKRGQVLVSGYTDCGIYIQATNSEAEILAQTKRHLDVVTPSKGQLRQTEIGRKRKYSLILGKKRINLWKGSGIPDSSCGRIYKEKYATLPGGFRLPAALCIEEYIFYETQVGDASRGSNLSSFAQQYLKEQMTAGTILSKEERITTASGIIRLEGNYTCQEMIGRVQQEQIGDEHGKIH